MKLTMCVKNITVTICFISVIIMGQDKVAVLPFKQQAFMRDDGNIFSDRVTIELFKLGSIK